MIARAHQFATGSRAVVGHRVLSQETRDRPDSLHHRERAALRLGAHEEIELSRREAERLLAFGYYRSIGAPRGQVLDYRRRLSDDRGMHLRIYRHHATLHWDHVDPSASLLGHLIRDAPGLLAAGAILGAAALGG